MTLPWYCDFGTDINAPDDCNMTQDKTDVFDWTFNIGDTDTKGTGPPQDTWESQGNTQINTRLTIMAQHVFHV